MSYIKMHLGKKWKSLTYSSFLGWWRTMCIILPGGKSGWWTVREIALSFGWIVTSLTSRRERLVLINSSLWIEGAELSRWGRANSGFRQQQHRMPDMMVCHYNEKSQNKVCETLHLYKLLKLSIKICQERNFVIFVKKNFLIKLSRNFLLILRL